MGNKLTCVAESSSSRGGSTSRTFAALRSKPAGLQVRVLASAGARVRRAIIIGGNSTYECMNLVVFINSDTMCLGHPRAIDLREGDDGEGDANSADVSRSKSMS